MAKLGEGDPRWIVKHRDDGANVNAWHWEEKNCLKSFESRLKEVVEGLEVINTGECTISIKTVESIGGSMSMNQRKGKKFLVYDLEDIKFTWEGTQGSVTAKGDVVVSEFDCTDELDDITFTVKCSSEKADKAVVNNLAKKHCLDAVKKNLWAVIKEVEAAATATKATESGEATPGTRAAISAEAAKAKEAFELEKKQHDDKMKAAEAEKRERAKAAKASTSESGGSISLEEEFSCGPQEIFECFTNPQRISAYTGARSVASAEPKMPFSFFDGSISGENVIVIPNEKIIQRWRLRGWADGVMSTVEIEISAKDSSTTKLTLKQTGIPETDAHGNDGQVKTTEDGWKRNIFNRIRMVFGYGAVAFD